jgi:hypothetical protein
MRLQEDYVPTLVDNPITEEEVEEIPIKIEAVSEEPESELTVEDTLEAEVVTNLDNISDNPESNNNQIETNDTNDFDWF